MKASTTPINLLLLSLPIHNALTTKTPRGFILSSSTKRQIVGKKTPSGKVSSNLCLMNHHSQNKEPLKLINLSLTSDVDGTKLCGFNGKNCPKTHSVRKLVEALGKITGTAQRFSKEVLQLLAKDLYVVGAKLNAIGFQATDIVLIQPLEQLRKREKRKPQSLHRVTKLDQTKVLLELGFAPLLMLSTSMFYLSFLIKNLGPILKYLLPLEALKAGISRCIKDKSLPPTDGTLK